MVLLQCDNMADSSAKRVKLVQTRRFCPHCNQNVANRTFFRHQEKYYNPSTKMWQPDSHYETSSEEEFEPESHYETSNSSGGEFEPDMDNELLTRSHSANEDVPGPDVQGVLCLLYAVTYAYFTTIFCMFFCLCSRLH